MHASLLLVPVIKCWLSHLHHVTVGSEKLTKQRDRGHDILIFLRVLSQLTPDPMAWLFTKATKFIEATFIEETLMHTSAYQR
jgi:hypothetical protein